MYLVIIDGGAEWVAAESMVKSKFPWIYFMHCVSHETSLIVSDICKIEKVIVHIAALLIHIDICSYIIIADCELVGVDHRCSKVVHHIQNGTTFARILLRALWYLSIFHLPQ